MVAVAAILSKLLAVIDAGWCLSSFNACDATWHLSSSIWYRMADCFTCEEIVQLVTGDAWDVSEGENDDDDELSAFESDPLDREQLDDLPSDMSPQDNISQEIAMNVDESSDEDDSVPESNTSTATPFAPPPFSHPS